MRFISSDQLIARVNQNLSSYKASGNLDEGDFYRWIKEILAMLNTPSFSEKHSIEKVTNHRLMVPDDLYQLWSVWSYDIESYSHQNTEHFQHQSRWFVTKTSCLEKVECSDTCERSLYEEGDIMVSKTYIQDSRPYTVKYKNKQPIKIINHTAAKCIVGSPALTINTKQVASLTDNYFTFDSPEGYVYLQYYSLLLDENGLPMIPDIVEVSLAIENYIIYRAFQKLYYNTTADVLQRMQFSQIEYQKAFDKAKTYVKFPTKHAFMELAESNQGRYKRYELNHSRK